LIFQNPGALLFSPAEFEDVSFGLLNISLGENKKIYGIIHYVFATACNYIKTQ
jgi:energy-coupling factor transporter ATP-binding protein EcfA2